MEDSRRTSVISFHAPVEGGTPPQSRKHGKLQVWAKSDVLTSLFTQGEASNPQMDTRGVWDGCGIQKQMLPGSPGWLYSTFADKKLRMRRMTTGKLEQRPPGGRTRERTLNWELRGKSPRMEKSNSGAIESEALIWADTTEIRPARQ